MSRSMYPGSLEYVWGVITETTGEDISAAVVELISLPTGQFPTDASPWLPPDDTDIVSSSQRRDALLIEGERINGRPTRYTLWARMTDTPEVPILKVGSFTVK